jgi:nucleotide-binding universal stress UspA family protein
MARRILHPTDFSRASGAAFSRALTETRANRAALTLVHVLTPVISMGGEGYASPSSVYEQLTQTQRAWAGKR